MRAQGVAWFELWPTDRLIPLVGDAVDPWTYWGEDQQPDHRFTFRRHAGGVPIVADFPRGPARL
jgi:hypothetical protein